MILDYARVISEGLPPPRDFPPAMQAQVPFVFSITFTDPHSMDVEGLASAARRAVVEEADPLAQYPPPQGHQGLRELIARRLAERRGARVDPDSIFLSAGAAGAIETVLEALVEPGDPVLVEEYTYLGTLSVLLQRGAHVVHVATDDRGMDPEALEEALRQLQAQGRRPKLIYAIPVYQNPTGITWDMERRRRVLEVAQEYGVPVLENESYADFRIDGPPLPPAMLGMDRYGAVIYVSAYTKLLGCGLRLGFCVFPEGLREALSRLRFGTSPSHLSAATVYHFLRDGAEGHVERVRRSLKAKRDAMVSALAEHFPEACSWTTPHGGMMVWLRLPEGADTWAALDAAVDAGVKYNPGPLFRAARDRRHYLRLTYSYNSPEEIREGIARLAQVFRRLDLLG